MIECNVPEVVAPFFNDRLGLRPSPDFRGVLWVPDEFKNRIAQMCDVAVAVGYDSFIGKTCCMHTVIQRPDLLSRRMLRDAFEFPFMRCGCEAVLALVDSTNEAALSLDTRLGFHEIARIPHAGPDADLVLLVMERAACRWLRLH